MTDRDDRLVNLADVLERYTAWANGALPEDVSAADAMRMVEEFPVGKTCREIGCGWQAMVDQPDGPVYGKSPAQMLELTPEMEIPPTDNATGVTEYREWPHTAAKFEPR